MATNALHRVASYQGLYDAWRHVFGTASRRSKNTTGVDGVSINDFAIDPHRNLRAAVPRAIDPGFQFDLLKPYFIPRDGKKDRLICVPTVRDRVIQRALLQRLTSKYGARFNNDISYGFVRDRSVADAARRACALRAQAPWAFKTDITAFFDNIIREHLHAVIRQRITDTSLHRLLDAAVECEVDVSKRKDARQIAELEIRAGRGVRQGMPLSPFFANMVLQNFDAGIKHRRLRAIRYADDLIFFAHSKEECLGIEEFCKVELARLQLEIPSLASGSKTVIYRPEESAEFLGLALSPASRGRYELRITSEQIARMRDALLRLGSVEALVTRGIRFDTLHASLQARVAGYEMAYAVCTNHIELEHELENIEQKMLRHIYRDELGIDLHALTPTARTFLRL